KSLSAPTRLNVKNISNQSNPVATRPRSSIKGTGVKKFISTRHPFLVTFRACRHSQSACHKLCDTGSPNSVPLTPTGGFPRPNHNEVITNEESIECASLDGCSFGPYRWNLRSSSRRHSRLKGQQCQGCQGRPALHRSG